MIEGGRSILDEGAFEVVLEGKIADGLDDGIMEMVDVVGGLRKLTDTSL